MTLLKAAFLTRYGYAYKGGSRAEMDKLEALITELDTHGIV